MAQGHRRTRHGALAHLGAAHHAAPLSGRPPHHPAAAARRVRPGEHGGRAGGPELAGLVHATPARFPCRQGGRARPRAPPGRRVGGGGGGGARGFWGFLPRPPFLPPPPPGRPPPPPPPPPGPP